MWLRSIKNIKPPAWLRYPPALRENKNLRTAALICAALLGANMLLYFVLVVPSAAWLGELEARHTELRKRHAEAVLFQQQKQTLAEIRAGIPAQKDMPLLVKDLVQTARRLNLKVATVTYDIPRRGNGGLTMLSFSFPTEGAYPDVKRFIYEIESGDRPVGIQELRLDSERGRVKLQMKLVTYIKGE